MAKDTRRVQGRRALRFQSVEEILADAEGLVAAPTKRSLGNWVLNQLLMHLTYSMNHSIDGNIHLAPWYFRLLGRLFKRRVMERGMEPGFKLPRVREVDSFVAAASDAAALDALRKAVARVYAEQMTALHPFFGKLTHEEWRRLHCRHAELHLSFVVPS